MCSVPELDGSTLSEVGSCHLTSSSAYSVAGFQQQSLLSLVSAWMATSADWPFSLDSDLQ